MKNRKLYPGRKLVILMMMNRCLMMTILWSSSDLCNKLQDLEDKV